MIICTNRFVKMALEAFKWLTFASPSLQCLSLSSQPIKAYVKKVLLDTMVGGALLVKKCKTWKDKQGKWTIWMLQEIDSNWWNDLEAFIRMQLLDVNPNPTNFSTILSTYGRRDWESVLHSCAVPLTTLTIRSGSEWRFWKAKQMHLQCVKPNSTTLALLTSLPKQVVSGEA